MTLPPQRPHIRAQANELIDFLTHLQRTDNRGALAVLKKSLTSHEASRMRAWQMLVKYHGLPDPSDPRSLYQAEVVRVIAGLFCLPNLYHFEKAGNFGKTCRTLLDDEERKTLYDPEKLGPLSRRFLLLLAADQEEITERTVRIARRISQKKTALNFITLYEDLYFWGSSVKNQWAAGFWNARDTEVEP